MNTVRFTIDDGTIKDFCSDKFTDKHIKAFNRKSCSGIDCDSCPLNSHNGNFCDDKGFPLETVQKCELITNEKVQEKTQENKMEDKDEIIIGQIYYGSDKFFRKPFCIHGERVHYEISRNPLSLSPSATGYIGIDEFLRLCEIYNDDMTFKRINDEGIKELISNDGNIEEIVGFTSSGMLVTYCNENSIVMSWEEDQIKNWKVK